MNICKEAIVTGRFPENFSVPHAHVFELREKVLQFGTGVLLKEGCPIFILIRQINKMSLAAVSLW